MLWKRAHHILMCLVILYLKTSLAQFKVISGSSRRQQSLSSEFPSAAPSFVSQKSMRTRSLLTPTVNSNVTYVQMKPMLSVNTYDTSEEVRPRGFSNDLFGKTENNGQKHLQSKHYSMFKRRPAKQSKVIKLNILDSTSPIRQSRIRITKKRVGKLQENALRINNELLASGSGKSYQSIIRIKPTNRTEYSNYPVPPSAVTRKLTTKLPVRSIDTFVPLSSETSLLHNKIASDPQFTEKLLIKRLKLRPYKTKCRCDKIWNCTKMQMSIARCPADTFMCCD